MKDILINLNDNWAEKHWKSIQSAYAKSPYFEHYSDAVKAILFQKHTNLLDLNKSIAQWVLEKLDKNIEIQVTTSFQEASKKRLKQFSVRNLNFPRYYQTFEEKYGFQPDLSIIDGLMNLGPELRIHLKN